VKDPYGNQIQWETLSPASAVEYLGDTRPFVCDRAVQRLVDQEAASIEPLTHVLRTSNSAAARTRAVFVLYRIGTAEALSAMRTGLNDADLQVRVAAARSAGLAKDIEAVNQLIQMVQKDEPAVRRQAATALGQIGEARAVPVLLAAAEGVKDRFVEHAIIFALISINQPDLLAKALENTSPEVRKTALIVLDQMPASSLQPRQLTSFLTSQNEELERTALWVASHHPEWAEEMITFLQVRFKGGSMSGEEKKLYTDMLGSFCGDASMQQFMAEELKGASKDHKLFLLNAMGACEVEELPQIWIRQIGQQLITSNDPEVKSRALEMVRLRGITSLDAELRQVADNKNNAAGLRIDALGALAEAQPKFTDAHFAYLYEQLQPHNEAPLRQQAASVLGQGELTEAQLMQLATEYLPQADAFILPRLMPVFRGGHNSEIGKALATTLMNSQSLDGFSEENVQTMFAGYSTEVQPAVDQLMTKLREVRAERLERIQALENQIAEGNIERGRTLFFGKAICWTCHAIGEEGGTLGPDLTSIQRDRSAHDLLEAIVYPSVSFVREYETYRIKTETNEYTGIIQEQTSEALVLGTAPQTSVRVGRDEIVSMEVVEVSMMPQGLDQLLTPQEMSDLMAFVLGQDQDPETDAAILR
jgi:putative heme-binding domain-containing protein